MIHLFSAEVVSVTMITIGALCLIALFISIGNSKPPENDD